MHRTWIAILACLPLAGCLYFNPFANPPGKGPEAKQRFEQSAPVIAALERYHATHGTYPDSLSSLVPDEMAKLPDMYVPNRDSLPHSVQYSRIKTSYELQFRYVEGGMNICLYQPHEGWFCHGYI